MSDNGNQTNQMQCDNCGAESNKKLHIEIRKYDGTHHRFCSEKCYHEFAATKSNKDIHQPQHLNASEIAAEDTNETMHIMDAIKDLDDASAKQWLSDHYNRLCRESERNRIRQIVTKSIEGRHKHKTDSEIVAAIREGKETKVKAARSESPIEGVPLKIYRAAESMAKRLNKPVEKILESMKADGAF